MQYSEQFHLWEYRCKEQLRLWMGIKTLRNERKWDAYKLVFPFDIEMACLELIGASKAFI